MRKFSAHYIITGTGSVLRKGIVVVNDNGLITEVIDTGGDLRESASVEFYNGILIPGFVNAHCHLELSHLRNVFPQKKKLPDFLKRVLQFRFTEPDIILKAAQQADREMWENGISVVGDISNQDITLQLKKTSPIHYYTFIESLGFSPDRAEKAFAWSQTILSEAKKLALEASVVPHAPYSISKDLFFKIANLAKQKNSVLSMHSQESTHEDDLFRSGTGEIQKHLTDNLLMDLSFFTPSGKSALETVLEWLPKENHLLLVHNTCTREADICIIQRERSLDNTWLVLCPNSNLFIEDRLPDVKLFYKHHLKLCIGTDSLSSNRQLSVLEELKTITAYFPEIPLPEVMIWATRNGAEALKMEKLAGTLEVGKKPGINLIENMDLFHMRLTPESKIRRLI
jgi:cytosine/adenosine deaminase-related metal-dependent hydrolase